MSAQLDVNIDKIDGQMVELIDAFESHPQIQPPNTHPTVFFLLDFIRNTHRMLKDVDPAKFAAGDSGARNAAQEILGRNQFANVLVNDSSGKLALMTGSDPNNPVDLGPEIKAKARALTEV
ncbi:hypothetical protein NUU61_000492 [Penicillium alfredii]|uniref:Uncharacterized protein n=1 Tax=Penicillium alfredii TaxID=1506179 RepID=A0A9W9KR43_9EURO|nr:uncharacterized protein NUU61_000492 [Penicillium alfredii]KAJ5114733.1 hypothetical protein NUU61_000492 [Penicillium alfredii]